MKRYELMTSKDVIDAYAYAVNGCENCSLKNEDCTNYPCISSITRYLQEEVKHISRWERIKCDDDLTTLYKDFITKHGNTATGYSADQFYNFLLEKIPDGD